MSEELKPCPFCHSDNVFHLESRLPGYDKYLYFVNCASCDANGPTNKISVEQAVNDWNAWAKPIGNPEELPEWVKVIITTWLQKLRNAPKKDRLSKTKLNVAEILLNWVLSLRRGRS